MINLKANEIKEIIALGLQDKMALAGFSYKKTMNEYKQQKGDFTYLFNIDQVAWTDSFSLDVRLYISQKRIEGILEKIIGRLRHKITLGDDIGRIYNSPDGKEIKKGNLTIWLREDEDIEAAIETLEWYFKDIAVPYFNKYDNLESINELLNNPPFEYSPADVGGDFDERCMKGLIVARLVGNQKYDKLVDKYDEMIKETMKDASIMNYYKVKEFLMYNEVRY